MSFKKSIASLGKFTTEPEYRADPALSQSSISKYEKEGFEKLGSLFDKIETASLSFGSCVDCYITDGEKAFNDKYYVADIPPLKPSSEPIIKALFEQCHNAYTDINAIPDSVILPLIQEYDFLGKTKYGDLAKIAAIRKDGEKFYQTMFQAGDKIVIPQATYNKVFACVRALKDSPQTKAYFADDDPFSSIERCYQLKLKDTIDGNDYKGMMDLVVINHAEKVVIPCDLKTSHNREYNFPKSFLEFRYDIQARLYAKLLRMAMDKDEYFKNFKLLNFRFIVVNNIDNPYPLVWEFPSTFKEGTIELGNRILRAPEVIGAELYHYLREQPKVPDGISLNKPNNIENWFNTNKYES